MKQLSFSNRLITALALAAVLATAPGCGNWMKAGVHTASPSSYKNIGASYSDLTANGGFPDDTTHTCPSNATTETTPGADKYAVCQGSQSSFDISLHGVPSKGRATVCVFPVDVVSGSEPYVVRDANGYVVDRCLDMSSDYNVASFLSARFNAVFVVALSDEADMAWCLSHNQPSACPAHFYERWSAYDTGAVSQ